MVLVDAKKQRMRHMCELDDVLSEVDECALLLEELGEIDNFPEDE